MIDLDFTTTWEYQVVVLVAILIYGWALTRL